MHRDSIQITGGYDNSQQPRRGLATGTCSTTRGTGCSTTRSTQTGDPAGGITFTYDNNGNLSAKLQGGKTTTYAYDVRDQLRGVTAPDGSKTASLDYDFGRRRLAKTTAATSLTYAYDGDQVVDEFSNTGTLVNRYDWGADLARGEIAGEGERFYFSDGLGSVTALSGLPGSTAASVSQPMAADKDGVTQSSTVSPSGLGPAAKYEYDAWGSVISDAGSANTFQYTGQKLDSETGLMALGNGERYYSSRLGRFQQEDSFGGSLSVPTTLNRHAYANDSPTNIIDPTGLYGISDAASDFWKGFSGTVLEPFKLLADADMVASIIIIPELRDIPLKDLQFSSGPGQEFHNRLEKGEGVAGAAFWTLLNVEKGAIINHFFPTPIRLGVQSAKLTLDYRAGRITKDQYYGGLAKTSGQWVGSATLDALALVGLRGAFAARAGAVEARAAGQLVEDAAGTESGIRPLTNPGASGEGAGLSGGSEGRLLNAGKEPLALPSADEPLQLGEGSPNPTRFIADESGNVQDLATGRGNPNSVGSQGPIELGPGEGPGLEPPASEAGASVQGLASKGRPGPDVYGPHYEQAGDLAELDPEFFPDPDAPGTRIVKGQELARLRARYLDATRTGALPKGHHRQGLLFGGRNVASNITRTGESTITTTELNGLNLDFYSAYGNPNAKVLKLYQSEPGGIIRFGLNPRHTAATTFQNAVRRWQEEEGLR